MLGDRDYMRQPEYGTPRVSWTVVLLLVNAVVFLAQRLASYYPKGAEIQNQYFALSLDGLRHGYVWQFLTFQFMHGGWMHIIFNSLAIYTFGSPVEAIMGCNRFLGLYFISGIFGGIVQMVYALIMQQFFPGMADSAVVGASAGAAGLVAAFAVINWMEPFTMIIYFIPVNMRGRTLLWGSFLVFALMMLNYRSNVANAAHLGGLLAGFVYAVYSLHTSQLAWPQWLQWSHWRTPKRKEPPREVVATRSKENKFWRSAPEQEDVPAEQFMQNEVDPILDKISAHGIQSLTAKERAILEAARKKMTRS